MAIVQVQEETIREPMDLSEEFAARQKLQQQWRNQQPEIIDAEVLSVEQPQPTAAQLMEMSRGYEDSGRNLEGLTKNFEDQSKQSEATIEELGNQYAKIEDGKIGAVETSFLAGAASLAAVKVADLANKNFYNAESVVDKALDATVTEMGKGSPFDPRNWFNGNAKRTVQEMQDGVKAAVTEISGPNLAEEIGCGVKNTIKNGGAAHKDTIKLNTVLGRAEENIAGMVDGKGAREIYKNTFDNVAKEVTGVTGKLPEAMRTEEVGKIVDDLARDIKHPALADISGDTVKNFVAQDFGNIYHEASRHSRVDEKTLGNAESIKEKIQAEAGKYASGDAAAKSAAGKQHLVDAATEDMRNQQGIKGKIANIALNVRETLTNFNDKHNGLPKKAAIVGLVVGTIAGVVILADMHNKNQAKRQEELDRQAEEEQQKIGGWRQKAIESKQLAGQAYGASAKLAQMADWQSRLEESATTAPALVGR